MGRHARKRDQGAGDGDVDHRPRDGDGDLVPGILRDTPQGGHAANRQERNALHLHAELLGDHAMSQFVKRDAGKYRAEHRDRPARAVESFLHKAAVGDEGQEQQEGEVQPQADAEYAPDWKRPFHSSYP